MSLDDLRTSIEDAYYSLGERVPHLPFVLAAALILLAAGLYLIFAPAVPQEKDITILVKNPASVPVKGAEVKALWGGAAAPASATTDSEGSVSFRVPSKTGVNITVTKQGYAEAKRFVGPGEGERFEVMLKLAEATGPKEVTITFVGPDGRKLSGREINVRLGCTGTGKFPLEEYSTSTGELKVASPENCGRITVTANVAGFRTASDNVLSGEWIVKFHGIEQPRGRVKLDVKDAETGNFLDGISVALKDELGDTAGTAGTSFGEAEFNVPVGAYTAIISDPDGRYGTRSLQVSVDGGDAAKRQEVLLTREIRLKAKVRVSEKAGGVGIAGATVTLKKNVGTPGATAGQAGTEVDGKKTGADGNALFLIAEDGNYTITASKDGYIAARAVSFRTSDFQRGSEKHFDIALEKCSSTTCGLLIVRVLDENGTAVENAAVALLNPDGTVAPYGTKATDFNGYTQQFSGIAPGKYVALANKYPSQGRSEEFEVGTATVNTITMKIIIGTGRVNVAAADQSGNGLAFSTADIYNDYGTKLGTIPLDAEGRGSLPRIKADKRVYAIVRKDGYAPYFTSHQQVMKDRTIHFNAVLEQGITGDRPVVEFRGIFAAGATTTPTLSTMAAATPSTGTTATIATGTTAGTTAPGGASSTAGRAGLAADPFAAVQTMQAGKTYIAKFLLKVPTGAGLGSAGFFIRAGNKEGLENEVLWIESSSAPMPAITKGSTYRPPNGETSPTTGNAKWVSLEWNQPEGGKYEIEVGLRVAEGATKSTELPLYYRTWGVKDGRHMREPLDRALGENFNTPVKGNTYAESYPLIYLEGIEQQCREAFCFTTRLLDSTVNLYVQQPYKVKTFSPYTLEFTLTNNSTAILDDASLSFRNTKDGTKTEKELSIESYEITDADAVRKSSATPAFEAMGILSGNLRQNRSMRGELSLLAKTNNASALQFTLTAGQNIAFASLVPFTVFFQDDINISASPDNLPALIPNDIAVTVQYTQGDKKGFPVEGAKVLVVRRSPDLSETTFTADTNAQGIAVMRIPASSPGTKLIIRVEKAGAGARVVEREIGAQVAAFTPGNVRAQLNRETKEQSTARLVAENSIVRALVVKRLGFAINSRGLLDEEKMQGHLAQYIGGELPRMGSQKEIGVLSALGKEVGFLDTPRKVEGKFIAELALKDDLGIAWVTELPYSAEINLAEMPANAPCIVVSSQEWKDTTLNGRAELELELENNCVTGEGEPVVLRNLQAQLEWRGNDGITGQVELAVTDPRSGSVAGEVLQEGIWVRSAERFEPRVIYPARLTFVPKPGTLGKKAEFTVRIDAELTTNAGRQLVGSSNPVEGEITITNLDQCIEITPHPEEGLVFEKDTEEQELIIDTTKCGPIGIGVRFCGGGRDFCRGGTREGGLTVRPWQFSNVHEETRTARVEKHDLAGFYGLTVEARPSGGAWRQVAEVDTIVKPSEGEYFDLEKYEFTAIGKGSSDETSLFNRMLQENVQVKANQCAWQSAQPGLGDAEKAGIGLGAAAAGAGIGYAAVLLGASTGIGAVVGLVVFVIILFMSIFGDDPCEKFETHTLPDYVINLSGTSDKEAARYLPPDALDIIVGNPNFRAEWNTNVTDAVQKMGGKNPNGKQTAGVVFSNYGGVQQQEPLYMVATMRATEHVHGDATHKNASVQCGEAGSEDGDFGPFWINPGTCGTRGSVYDTTYQQKFHLKFRTAEERVSLPKVTFDSQACQSGIDIGRTGKGALPRVKFSWSWKEDAGGIGAEACDQSNPEYIYCDATQFTIELNKKLNRLYEFLQANDFDLGCPLLQDAQQDVQEELEKTARRNEVRQGMLGLREIKLSEEAGSIKAGVVVVNNTSADQNVKVRIAAAGNAAGAGSCEFELKEMAPGEEREGTCNAGTGADGTYVATAVISESTQQTLTDRTEVRAAISIGDPLKKNKEDACKLKVTETAGGELHILRYIEGKDNIRWTEAVPDKEALRKLLVFNSYLMKDNYSKEFFRDFADYYTNRAFEDTDVYFHSIGEDSGGKYGFNRLMDQDLFRLRRKYVDTSELAGPGLYRVELALAFGENDWRFFDATGKPSAFVAVIVSRVDEPFPGSPFYSLPLDGFVGLKGDSFERANYGLGFRNTNQENIEINNEASPLRTYEATAGVAGKEAEVRVVRDLYSMNVSPESRGMLLMVDTSNPAMASILFQPSHATPVMMKASRASITEEKFMVQYSLLQGEQPLNPGNTLAYWDGAGTCLDFTGAPVTEAFYQKPDRSAAPDGQTELRNYYGLEWPAAIKTGEVYLRTIMYTDPQGNYNLKAKQGSPISFLTADDTGEVVPLRGIAGMPYNNAGGGSISSVSSMQDVFSLAEQGEVCVSNNGNTTKFFWNPQKIFASEGTQRNVSAFTNSLEAGSTCIG